MSKMMYRTSSGSIANTETGKPGDHLVATSNGKAQWEKFNASKVPYLNSNIDAPGNVAGFLDAIIKASLEIGVSVSQLEAGAKALEETHYNDIEGLTGLMRNMQAVISDLTEKSKSETHPAIRVAPSSNPALRIEFNGQLLRLDLSQSGSFDDSLTNIGAQSIQDAIVKSFLYAKSVSTKVEQSFVSIREMEQRINDLQSSVTLLFQQVRQLSDHLDQVTTSKQE